MAVARNEKNRGTVLLIDCELNNEGEREVERIHSEKKCEIQLMHIIST